MSEKNTSYHVPALEKGLDIIELIAKERSPLSAAQIGETLGRSRNELFRMLSCLEQRNYLYRDEASGNYSLTLRMFELSHQQSDTSLLLRAASAPMQRLTELIGESCHISILNQNKIIVLHQAESSRLIRISVGAGALLNPYNSVSGRLLLSYLSKEELTKTLNSIPEFTELKAAEQKKFIDSLKKIHTKAVFKDSSDQIDGIIDIATLVGLKDSTFKASLAITYIPKRAKTTQAEIQKELTKTAQEITKALGY